MDDRSEPVFNVPGVILALIAGLSVIHGLREWEPGEVAFLWDFALIPARFSAWLGADPMKALAEQIAGDRENGMLVHRLALAREIAMEDSTKPWTLLTYAGLHGSWMHLVLNSIWLLAFGSAVARRFGSARFLLFFAITAIAGGVAHVLAHMNDVVPMVGASAAVSGCMAAAIRFVFQPGAPLGVFRQGEEHAYQLPALPLSQVLGDRRVVSFLVVWFVMNLATGLGGSGLGITDATIAWEAHVGGFLAGLFSFQLFERRTAPALLR